MDRSRQAHCTVVIHIRRKRGWGCGSAAAASEGAGAAAEPEIHLQARGRAGSPVSTQTQDRGARERAGKLRMISVMTSSFRHTILDPGGPLADVERRRLEGQTKS